MAGKRLDIMDFKQLIRLRLEGLSNRRIADLLKISRNTVNEYSRLLGESGLTPKELLTLDDGGLKDLLAPESEVATERYEQLASSFEYFSAELRKPGCTLLTLWHEYRQRHPEGYQYTQFTHHYNQWAKKLEPSGKLEHKAGQKVFIDYTGKQLSIVDRSTGEIKQVDVFVAILPSSRYTFVEASENQQRHNLIGSIVRCLEFFGGCPQAIVSDCLKSAVSRASRYEPVINKSLKDLGIHYGLAIDPARPYSPQDKALVENAVHLVYQRIFYPLSKTTFFSLAELNEAIRELLIKYNNYTFKQINYSRKELFVATEKAYLKPLPASPYEPCEYRRAKVQKMGYVLLTEDKHYYSVPYRFIGCHVEVRYTQRTVEIYHQQDRLCSHKRDRQPGKYSTIADHPSSAHRAYTQWSLEFFEEKGNLIGPETGKYIRRLILQYNYPEIGYKQSMGIVQLVRQYDKARIEKACAKGMNAAHCSFRLIESMLRSGADQMELDWPDTPPIPAHENIRGPQYYQ